MSSDISRFGSSIDSQCYELCRAKTNVLLCLSYYSKFVYIVRGKDRGREAWHRVLVDGDKKEEFLEKFKTGSMDAADYGQILCSGFGKEPPKTDKIDFENGLQADLHLIKEKDNSWHYVSVDQNKRYMFEEKLKAGSAEAIEDCVTVLHSGWGQDPPESFSSKAINVYINNNKSVGLCNKHPSLQRDFARSGKLEEIRQIIDKGFDIHDIDENGWSPLHHAAYSGNVEVVEFLTDKGADIHLKDKICGRKPIHIAAREGHVNVIKFFVDRHVRVNDADRNGWMPMHYAAWKGSLDALQLLRARGAITDVKDTYAKRPIHIAAREGHAHVVDFLLKGWITTEDRDIAGRTPLYYAAWYGQLATVDFLIHMGADIHAENIFETRPLHVAASSGHIRIVERFLSEGLDVDERTVKNNTPLHSAAQWNQLEAARFLVEKGADINAKNNEGRTPLDVAREWGYTTVVNILRNSVIRSCPTLHFAAMKGDLKAVNFFLNEDTSVNAVDKKNYTPLHYAAEYGNLNVVNLLLDKGADILTRSNPDSVLHLGVRSNQENVVKLILDTISEKQEDTSRHINAQNTEGDTPLICAAQGGSMNIVEMLLQHGADVRAKNNEGLTALHRAAEKGHFNLAKFLVDEGADIHAINNYNSQPLHCATTFGHTDMMEFFISKGVSVDSVSNFGTPLHCAAYAGDLKAAKFLIDRRADIHALNSVGMKPIHCAILCASTIDGSCNTDVIELLLNNGACVNDTDTFGKTPLHYSVLLRKLEIVEFLMKKKASVRAKDRYGKTPVDWAKEKNYSTIGDLLESLTINSS